MVWGRGKVSANLCWENQAGHPDHWSSSILWQSHVRGHAEHLPLLEHQWLWYGYIELVSSGGCGSRPQLRPGRCDGEDRGDRWEGWKGQHDGAYRFIETLGFFKFFVFITKLVIFLFLLNFKSSLIYQLNSSNE